MRLRSRSSPGLWSVVRHSARPPTEETVRLSPALDAYRVLPL